jgi:hypothetical protein
MRARIIASECCIRLKHLAESSVYKCKIRSEKLYKFGQRTQLDRAVRIGYGWKLDTDK